MCAKLLCSSTNFQHCSVAAPYPKRRQVVDLLVRKGAQLNEKNKDLLAPLHVAADCSHLDVVETLLRHGCKVNVLDAHGQTGNRKGKCECVHFLS